MVIIKIFKAAFTNEFPEVWVACPHFPMHLRAKKLCSTEAVLTSVWGRYPAS